MGAESAPFRVAYVRGVTPAKWARIWAERRPDRRLELLSTTSDQTETDQTSIVRDGSAQMAFVRLPIDRDGLNLIPLYEEKAVVVVAKDHVVAAVDEVYVSDLEDETVHPIAGDIEETFAVVAAGAGVVIVPQSIARLYARRDLTYRPVTDASPTQIALVWPTETPSSDADAAAIEEFIGIVRGRTARSSRGEGSDAAAAPAAKAPKRGKPPVGRAGSRVTKGAPKRSTRHPRRHR